MLTFFKKAVPQAAWLASTSFCVKAGLNEKMSLEKKETEGKQKELMTKRVYEPRLYWCPAGGVLLTYKESVEEVSNDHTQIFSVK